MNSARVASIANSPHDASCREEAGEALRRAVLGLRGWARKVRELSGFTPAEMQTLQLIASGAFTKMREIGATIHQTSGAVTRLVDRLEERGLVERTRSERDRRVIALSITTLGRDALGHASDDCTASWASLVAHLSDEECRTLSALLARIVDAPREDARSNCQSRD